MVPNVTVNNLDTEHAPPAYEGPANKAHTALTDGDYAATDEAGNAYALTVGGHGSTLGPFTAFRSADKLVLVVEAGEYVDRGLATASSWDKHQLTPGTYPLSPVDYHGRPVDLDAALELVAHVPSVVVEEYRVNRLLTASKEQRTQPNRDATVRVMFYPHGAVPGVKALDGHGTIVRVDPEPVRVDPYYLVRWAPDPDDFDPATRPESAGNTAPNNSSVMTGQQVGKMIARDSYSDDIGPFVLYLLDPSNTEVLPVTMTTVALGNDGNDYMGYRVDVRPVDAPLDSEPIAAFTYTLDGRA